MPGRDIGSTDEDNEEKMCTTCNKPQTISHIFNECLLFKDDKEEIFREENEDVLAKKVVTFQEAFYSIKYATKGIEFINRVWKYFEGFEQDNEQEY